MARRPDPSYRDTLTPAKSGSSMLLRSGRLLSPGLRRTFSSISSGINMARRVRRRLAYGRSRTTFRRRNRQRPTTGVGVTDHYDKKTIYRKKRMPYGRKRRWRKFVKRVLAVSENTLGTRSWVKNSNVARTLNVATGQTTQVGQGSGYPTAVANENVQIVGQVCLFGVESGTSSLLGGNDLQNIYNTYSTESGSTSMILESTVLDLTFTNTGYYQIAGDPPEIGTWPCKLEIDIYEITASKQFQVGGTGLNLIDCFNYGMEDTNASAVGGYTEKPWINLRGSTPFDQTQALAQFGIKIWKKTKFMLGYNESSTYQYRDPKRHVVLKKYMDECLGTNYPKLTKWLFFVIKPTIGYTYIPTPNEWSTYTTAEAVCHIGCSRKYNIKVNSTATDIGTMTFGAP